MDVLATLAPTISIIYRLKTRYDELDNFLGREATKGRDRFSRERSRIATQLREEESKLDHALLSMGLKRGHPTIHLWLNILEKVKNEPVDILSTIYSEAKDRGVYFYMDPFLFHRCRRGEGIHWLQEIENHFILSELLEKVRPQDLPWTTHDKETWSQIRMRSCGHIIESVSKAFVSTLISEGLQKGLRSRRILSNEVFSRRKRLVSQVSEGERTLKRVKVELEHLAHRSGLREAVYSCDNKLLLAKRALVDFKNRSSVLDVTMPTLSPKDRHFRHLDEFVAIDSMLLEFIRDIQSLEALAVRIIESSDTQAVATSWVETTHDERLHRYLRYTDRIQQGKAPRHLLPPSVNGEIRQHNNQQCEAVKVTDDNHQKEDEAAAQERLKADVESYRIELGARLAAESNKESKKISINVEKKRFERIHSKWSHVAHQMLRRHKCLLEEVLEEVLRKNRSRELILMFMEDRRSRTYICASHLVMESITEALARVTQQIVAQNEKTEDTAAEVEVTESLMELSINNPLISRSVVMKLALLMVVEGSSSSSERTSHASMLRLIKTAFSRVRIKDYNDIKIFTFDVINDELPSVNYQNYFDGFILFGDLDVEVRSTPMTEPDNVNWYTHLSRFVLHLDELQRPLIALGSGHHLLLKMYGAPVSKRKDGDYFSVNYIPSYPPEDYVQMLSISKFYVSNNNVPPSFTRIVSSIDHRVVSSERGSFEHLREDHSDEVHAAIKGYHFMSFDALPHLRGATLCKELVRVADEPPVSYLKTRDGAGLVRGSSTTDDETVVMRKIHPQNSSARTKGDWTEFRGTVRELVHRYSSTSFWSIFPDDGNGTLSFDNGRESFEERQISFGIYILAFISGSTKESVSKTDLSGSSGYNCHGEERCEEDTRDDSLEGSLMSSSSAILSVETPSSVTKPSVVLSPMTSKPSRVGFSSSIVKSPTMKHRVYRDLHRAVEVDKNFKHLLYSKHVNPQSLKQGPLFSLSDKKLKGCKFKLPEVMPFSFADTKKITSHSLAKSNDWSRNPQASLTKRGKSSLGESKPDVSTIIELNQRHRDSRSKKESVDLTDTMYLYLGLSPLD